ncbi:helix-turn-helix transcriptional regulator [Oscillospiraceae bacterium OttesenSCG-928-G22]|nr:helix-turn-helix transcriptional regulator [Oscillospiraceae bacterium OttesenSCG-928-G22]
MANKIREFRREAKMSQEKLSALSGLSRPFLSTVESGYAKPTIEKAIAIAKALGRTLDEVFTDEEDNEPT